MEQEFFNNALSRWAMGSGIAAGLYLTALLARSLLLSRVARLALHTSTRLDDLLVRILGSTYTLIILILALFAGSLALDLPPRAETVLSRVAVIAFLLQLALWGDKGVRSWRKVYHDRTAPTADAPGSSSMAVICFIMRLVLWVVISLMILDNLGVNITTLVTSLGIGGIAVALAVQNILGDLFASLSIVLDKPFIAGDFIIVGDALGTVEFIGLKTTRLRGLGGEQIIFSNADLLKSRIHNHQRMHTRRVALILRVTHQTSEGQLRAIPAIVRQAIEEQSTVNFERVHFSSCSESSLDFETVYHVNSADYAVHMDTQQAILLTVFSRFKAAGIEFAQQTRVLRMAAELAPGERDKPTRIERAANVH
jgi:small-conductance mechanosensitive channel